MKKIIWNQEFFPPKKCVCIIEGDYLNHDNIDSDKIRYKNVKKKFHKMLKESSFKENGSTLLKRPNYWKNNKRKKKTTVQS